MNKKEVYKLIKDKGFVTLYRIVKDKKVTIAHYLLEKKRNWNCTYRILR